MRLEASPHAELIIAKVADPDPRVQRRAVWALKEMSAPKLEPHNRMIGDMLLHKRPQVRTAAAELFGFMGARAIDLHKTNVRLLEEALPDPDVNVRRAVMDAFFKWGAAVPTSCTKAIAQRLDDVDAAVRRLCCLTLSNLGMASEPYCEKLSGLLFDTDAAVRRAAPQALAEIRKACGK